MMNAKKIESKYKNILQHGVFQDNGDTVIVSKDMFYKMVLKLYNYERFVDDSDGPEWEAQTIKEIDRNIMGLNWWQVKPENIVDLLKGAGLDGSRMALQKPSSGSTPARASKQGKE